MGIISEIKISLYKMKWRAHNKHNGTYPITIFDEEAVNVGNMTYGELYVLKYGKEGKLRIGHFCSIAPHVVFILSADHYLNHFSTFPFKVKMLGIEKVESISKGNITIDDDVWIGYGATILSGVHIGQGAVVAAGSVVVNDVPPYAIVGGVPAKVIKYRFSPEMITELLKVDYSQLTEELVKEHIEDLYRDLEDTSQLWWFPKK